jgi:hypothetical protein
MLWSCLNNRRGIGVAGCRGPWNETIEPDLVRYADSSANLRVSLLTAKPSLLTHMRRFCSAPASTAPSLHARGWLPCIRTCLWKRTESAVSPASRVGPASRCSCFDLSMGGGSTPCVAPPSSLHPVATSASPPFFPARRAITVLPPPQGPWSARTWPPPNPSRAVRSAV